MENVNPTRKKILFVVTQSEMGGAQRYVFETARGLKKGYNVLVAAGSPALVKATAGKGDGELFRKLKNTRVQPVYLKRMRRTPWPWQAISAVKEIVDLLKKERPDVLFLCSTTAGLLGSIAAFLYKLNAKRCTLKTIYRIGGWAFRDPRAFWKNWLVLAAEMLTAPLKDKIIVNSEVDRRLAIKYGIARPEKLAKIYNGINPDSLDFYPKQEAQLKLGFNQHGNNRTVGTVANFYKTKGLEYLIEAFDFLMSDSALAESDIKLFVIGDGRERSKLEELIKKYGLEGVVILKGRIPDAYKYLKAFDVFVLPSLKEGFPWIILEAMAAEVPIVASKVGALPEIIEDGREGLLVEPKNSCALAEKIKWLTEHPREAKTISIQAKLKLTKQFSLSKMVQETEKLLPS